MASGLDFNERQTYHLVNGCYLHDIGKLFIPDEILKKTAGLDSNEWEVMKTHPIRGVEWLKAQADVDQEIIDIIAYHHERWNGQGYPHGLSSDEIPALAHCCAILDSFDCMLSDRPYRKRLSLQEAREELLLQADKQFDKRLVNRLLNLSNEAFEIYGYAID
jgi:HD-GYP domain-containing protein (c-di-GMP phosphodiesterase class II)